MKARHYVTKVTQKEEMKRQISNLQHTVKKYDVEIEVLHRRINYLESIIIEMKKNQVAIDLSKLLK